ncbi:MAG: bifunctional UDP-sugar hydrolase/5'-nucleotidase [Ktedonobacteraceae bacterium]
MQPFIILYTNDIHGRIDGLARIATLVEQTRAQNPDIPVLYFDIGDIEENSVRLSNLTKGTAMHRLLSVSGCDIAVVGNGGILRYGHQVLPAYAQAASYPLLLANMYTPDGQLVPGVQPTALLTVGSLKLGLIGVTSDVDGAYASFNLHMPPVLPRIQEHAAHLRQQGARAIVLLSHLGLEVDRQLAPDLQNEVSLIIGAHSHHLLPEGEWIGCIFITQAGEYAQYLGKLHLFWDGTHLTLQHASVLPITDAIQPSPRLFNEINTIEIETTRYLEGTIGELAEPLDYASNRECGTANLMADMLRAHMQADLAIITAGAAFTGPLPAGPLRRVTLWEVCTSPANPGLVTMTGAQLLAIVNKGRDLNFAQDCPRPFRGQPRGLVHLSGATMHNGQLLIDSQPVDPEREYRVAGSDWELEPYGGYAEPSWNLQPNYDMPTILREALEAYLETHSPLHVKMGRLG